MLMESLHRLLDNAPGLPQIQEGEIHGPIAADGAAQHLGPPEREGSPRRAVRRGPFRLAGQKPMNEPRSRRRGEGDLSVLRRLAQDGPHAQGERRGRAPLDANATPVHRRRREGAGCGPDASISLEGDGGRGSATDAPRRGRRNHGTSGATGGRGRLRPARNRRARGRKAAIVQGCRTSARSAEPAAISAPSVKTATGASCAPTPKPTRARSWARGGLRYGETRTGGRAPASRERS